MVLTAVFFPAYMINVMAKTAVKLPFLPIIWMARIFNPNIVDDINKKTNSLRHTVKETADRSFMTMSSLIAK